MKEKVHKLPKSLKPQKLPKLHTVEEYNKKHNNELPEIVGEKVILAPIPESYEFYQLYCDWLSNKDLKYKIGEEEMEYTQQEVKEMHEEWKKDFKNMTFCILNKETKEPIGDINIFDSEDFKNLPEISIMLGQHSGKGFGTEASQLLLDFAFKKLKLSEVNLNVYKDNLPAVGLYKKLGFSISGEAKDEDGREEYLMRITAK
jgi:RimJ/RimL family protein N-acetyltransferase